MSNHTEYLRKDAIERVWCAPNQDHSYTFALPRVSGSSGALGAVAISGALLDLPDTFSRWQVFMIGGIPPAALNLLTRQLMWVSAEQQAREKKTSMRVFNNMGVLAGLADVFYRYTASGALLVAVRVALGTPFNWSQDKYYLSLYSNSWWNTPDGVASPVGFQVGAQYIDKSADIGTFDTKYLAAKAKAASPIQLSFWHNGVRKNRDTTTISVGDSVWFELDGSIKKRFTFPVRGLATFDSTLDMMRKYLLHPPKDDSSTSIAFIDDLEVFILANDAFGNAIKYVKLQPSQLRQLTHRDYSISVSAAVFQGDKLKAISGKEFDSFSIQVVVKQGGQQRNLIHEAAFIQELYKLDEVDIGRAMTGIDATVPFWRAAALEASTYPAIMRTESVCDLTYQMTEKAYGYYEMARTLANTPNEVISPGNSGYVQVPYLLMWGCTAYEYDQEGLLLSWHQHITGSMYFVKNDECRHVELIAGMGGRVMDEVHGAKTVTLRQDCNWRIYLRQRVGGQVQPAFKDVTGSNQYVIDDLGNFTWKSASVTDYVTVRSDRRFYAADYQVDLTEGRIAVTITTMQTHDGVTASQPMMIPLGQIDVFLNGHSLIRGLHYYYDNGQIVITAREYIDTTPGNRQRIHVRAMGFCRPDGSLYPEGDWGFIQHGLLSNNNRFDVRDGRVTRVIINGRLRTMQDLEFSESSDQVAPLDPINGQPYMVKDLFVPLKPFAEPDTWALIEKARADTKVVSDYITLKKPQPSRGPVQAIPRKHIIFSPFLAKILYDLIYGRLGLPAKDAFNRQDVIEVCKSYEPLLKTDPLQQGIDANFVVIVPHTKETPIAISPRQWQFMSQVVKYYGDGAVDLNSSLTVSS